MPPAPTVALVGMRALLRDLKRATDPLLGPVIKAMQEAGRKAAAPVAAQARGSVPKDEGTLAEDIRVTASRTGAAVRMGRKKVPYAPWIEFGGERHRPHFSERDFIKDGRYLFPAARGLSTTSANIYSEEIQKAFDAFNWTNQTTSAGAIHD
jgi:bacteriophage HK97-gp10 putative tail-component